MTAHSAFRTDCLAPATILARPVSQASKEPLQMAGTVVQAAQGREIFAEGAPADTFYKVVSGVVRICKFLSDGRRQIAAFHMAGEIFGLELGCEHQFSAEAVGECTLVSYRRRGIELLAQKDQAVAHQLLQFAMQNLAQAQAHALLLARRGAAERVAAFLLDWEARSSGTNVIHLEMSRQEIADYLALTIETVSRSLSQFERDRVIAMPTARDLRFVKPQALEELAA